MEVERTSDLKILMVHSREHDYSLQEETCVQAAIYGTECVHANTLLGNQVNA